MRSVPSGSMMLMRCTSSVSNFVGETAAPRTVTAKTAVSTPE